jgi:glycosyltransferase involved in cell wall biosynthesis
MAIYNPVHTQIDLGSEFAARPRDLIFVGRLVSQKGVPVLLDAMAKLKQRGVAASATIVGDGSDRQALEAQARAAGIDGQLQFTGRVDLARVNALLGEHKMMIVPSVYREPFPMAVLEGLAAGCLLIASHTGGLPEGVGPCGMTFPMRDSGALADRIEAALADPKVAAAFRLAIPAHLDTMRQDRIVDRYLEAFERFRRHRVTERMGIRKAARLTIAEMTEEAGRAL